MAQGDTFAKANNYSVTANSTDEITITAASGQHVAVHSMVIGSDSGNVGSSFIAYYDDSADNTIIASESAGSGSFIKLEASGSSSRYSDGKIFFDDEWGLKVFLENDGCNSMTQNYVITGQVVQE